MDFFVLKSLAHFRNPIKGSGKVHPTGVKSKYPSQIHQHQPPKPRRPEFKGSIVSKKIIELNKLLESAKLENKLFRMMANQIPNFSLIIFDKQMKYDIAEGSALADAGYDSKKMIGASIEDILPPNAVKMLKPLYQKTLNGESTEFEFESNLKHYATKFLPIRDTNEMITHGMIVIFDVTRLKEALLAAEKASKAKTTFIANLSHEIRTPMTGILGAVEILSEMPEHRPEVRDLLTTIENCGKSLLDLMEDILSYAKLEHEKDSLEYVPTNIPKLVNEVYQMFKPAIDEKSLTFASEINVKKSKMYLIDQVKIKQVLMNLVGNAIKFTESGNIKIRVNAISEFSSKDKEKIEFEVADSGIGISQEDQVNIFEAFTQADSSTTKKFGGTGLGLAISEKIIKMMAGTISLESQIGKGSTFKFEIAASFTEQYASSADKNRQAEDNNIALVVEDNYINQMVIKNHLQKLGFSWDIANNGLEALKLFEKKKYNIIFMDCSMPEMDGYLCTRKIREKHGDSTPPIIAVTANSTEENRKKCAESGMNDFISKPYSKDDLLRAITKNIYDSREINTAAPSFSRQKLLEEYSGQNQHMREILKHVLEFIPKSIVGIENNIKNEKMHIVYAKTMELKGVLCNVYATKPLNLVNGLLGYVNNKDLQRYTAFKELKEHLSKLQIEIKEFLDQNNPKKAPNHTF